MSDTYNVIFASRNANAVNITNLNAVKYTVNWDSMLNNKYKKYKCSFTFISEATGTAYSVMGLINMSFGCRTNSFDGTSQSDNIGIIYPVLNNVSYRYQCKSIDNPSFTMGYPNSNLITLNLSTFSNTTLSNMYHYVLVLNMVGIPDDE